VQCVDPASASHHMCVAENEMLNVAHLSARKTDAESGNVLTGFKRHVDWNRDGVLYNTSYHNHVLSFFSHSHLIMSRLILRVQYSAPPPLQLFIHILSSRPVLSRPISSHLPSGPDKRLPASASGPSKQALRTLSSASTSQQP
jgi:hypothetical protein